MEWSLIRINSDQTLEKDLKIKEKALAEAAALILLRKKVKAIWRTKGTND